MLIAEVRIKLNSLVKTVNIAFYLVIKSNANTILTTVTLNNRQTL